MSNAWEVTTEDVLLVLRAHGNNQDENQWFDELDCDAIESDVLCHTSFDQQVDQALSTIEDQLHEKGAFKHVQNFKKKYVVGNDDEYDEDDCEDEL